MRTKQNSVTRLARKFADSEQREEETWARDIFGEGSSSRSYVRLRSKLKLKTLSLLFDLDLQKGSELRRMMYANMRRVFMVRVLIMLGARRAAMSLVPAALARARKYELTSDTIELLRLARTHAAFEGNRLAFKKIDHELSAALRLRVAENQIASILERFYVESVGRSTVRPSLKRLTGASLDEATAVFEEFPTFNIGINYFRIATTVAEVESNFALSITLCKRASMFLKLHPHMQNKAFAGEFALKRLTAALSANDLVQGKSAVLECKQYFEPGGNNWFVMMEYEFLLYMHTQQFASASVCLEAVIAHGRFESQAEQVRQKWAIFQQYIVFMLLAKQSTKRKTLAKLIREVPIYSKDKAGYNISLIILQYLVLVELGKFDEVIVRSEALNQYLMRHLRTRKSGPLYAFLKSLVLLQRHDFNVQRASVYTKRYVQRFCTGYHSVEESQVLPYPQMWDHIITGIERATVAHSKVRRKKGTAKRSKVGDCGESVH